MLTHILNQQIKLLKIQSISHYRAFDGPSVVGDIRIFLRITIQGIKDYGDLIHPWSIKCL